jgi:exodeoxyribonuclease V alpha subunit
LLLRLEPAYDLSAPIDELIAEEYLVRAPCAEAEHPVYLKHLLRAEEAVAEFIAARAAPRAAADIGGSVVKKALAQAAASLGISFSYEQEHAVQLATEYPLLVITGGPGCGKTTIIRALALLYQLAGKRLLLAAPTGRAAQRMGQVCALPASTIHRLLKYDPAKGNFLHGVNDPLSADAVIIDEASMIDVQLARDLFSAIPRAATIILVGDKDQLPSVGPGRVFGDIISVSAVKTISLSRLFRRSEESAISTMAHLINSGTVPDIPEPDGVTRTDAYFIAKPDPEEAALTVEKLVADQIPRKFGISPAEICVLTPSNRGPLGTLALNQRLQARINPPPENDTEQELALHEYVLRLGDRVCQRVNNYNIDIVGVFNGDVGQVFHVDRKARSLTVEMWDGRLVKYEESDLSQLSLAYAVTVHRSQGSEIPCVVLVLHESHYTLLERQLVYTAVTRAKKLLIVVGSRKALNLGVKKMNSRRRCTLLKERIQTILDR